MQINPFTRKLLNRHRLGVLSERITDLADFCNTSLGQELLEDERALIQSELETKFGYHLLLISAFQDDKLLASSRIRNKIHYGFSEQSFVREKTASNCLIGCEQTLPFATDSLDVVVIQHVLDYSTSPHHFLKEVKRVVRPGGDIFVLGFNPFSWVGLFSIIGSYAGHAVWNTRSLSLSRLADWLTLLDLSVQSAQFSFFRMPSQKRWFGKVTKKIDRIIKFRQLPIGGVYLLTAKNEQLPLTPTKLKWRPIGQGLINQPVTQYYNGRNKKNLH